MSLPAPASVLPAGANQGGPQRPGEGLDFTPTVTESTHASRHPLRPVILPQVQQTNKEVRPSDSRATEALQEDYNDFFEKCEAHILEIAEKHSKKVEDIRRAVGGGTYLKSSRDANLWNALQHFKAQEMNAGRAPGQRCTPAKICKAVKEDVDLQALSIQEKSFILKEFEQKRVSSKGSVRATNHAATEDFTSSTDKIQKEMSGVDFRTGAVGMAFFGRGHVNNTMKTTYFGSNPKVLSFIPEVLKMTPIELALKFDAWSVAQIEQRDQMSLTQLQSLCSHQILEGLEKMTGKRGLTMEYTNYDSKIRATLHVELCNWPQMIEFKTPHKLTVRSELKLLHDSLTSGECHWAAMSCQALQELNGVLKVREKKTRKVRSDKDKPWGPRSSVKGKKGNENGPSQKQRKLTASQVPPLPKSQEFIASSDEEGSDEGGL